MWRKQILVTLVILFSDHSFAWKSSPLQSPPVIIHRFASVGDPIYYSVDVAHNPIIASSVMRGTGSAVQRHITRAVEKTVVILSATKVTSMSPVV